MTGMISRTVLVLKSWPWGNSCQCHCYWTLYVFLGPAEALRCRIELTGWSRDYAFFLQMISEEVRYIRSWNFARCCSTVGGWRPPIAFIPISGCRSCAEDPTDDTLLVIRHLQGFSHSVLRVTFYPRDAMLARVFATATCPSVRLSVRPSHAGIVTNRAKAGSWNVHHLIAPWL